MAKCPDISSLRTGYCHRNPGQANIIYGNIDYLKGKPLGKLVVTLSGEKEAMDQAIDYIRSLGVEMEVMKR